jgi:hypothetical protein
MRSHYMANLTSDDAFMRLAGLLMRRTSNYVELSANSTEPTSHFLR